MKYFERKTSEIRKYQRCFTDRCSKESLPNYVCGYQRGNNKLPPKQEEDLDLQERTQIARERFYVQIDDTNVDLEEQ